MVPPSPPTRRSALKLLAASAAALGVARTASADDRPAITVAVNELGRTLDPGEQWGQSEVRIYYSIYDTLIRRDFNHPAPGGGANLVPGLAESWGWTSPTTFEMKLRQGVPFHNGSIFSADDVVATFSPERLFGPQSYYPAGRVYFNTLAKVEKLDDHNVRFTTADHDAVLEHRLSGYMSYIISNDALNTFRKPGVDHKVWMDAAAKAMRWNPVGTGPYRFADYQRDDHVKLVAFDKYYEGAPAASSITFRAVPEVAARVAGLVAGDDDIAAELPPDQWDSVAAYKDLVLKTVELENSHVIVMNMSDPVLADKNLRHALSLAIDRQSLVDALWKGHVTVPNGHQNPSFGPLYIKDRVGYAYDPALAKKLLAQSSYKGQELSYRLVPNYYIFGVESAQILQEMWRAVGINVRIDFVDSMNDVRKKGVQLYLWSNTYRIPDPTGALLFQWGFDADVQTVFKYYIANPEFNRLSHILFVSSDTAERRATFAKMLDIFEDDMPMTMLYNTAAGYGMKKWVKWTPYSQYPMDFRPSNFTIGPR